MLKKKSSHKRFAYLRAFAGLALLLASTVHIRKIEALTSKSGKVPAQSASSSPIPGKCNGKLVVSSGKQNDGGAKIWTVNPDGSNPIQLTFESERDPKLPSYLHVHDIWPKWSPDGTKIAFHTLLRHADPPNGPNPDNYTIYIIDSQGNEVRRLILNQLPSL